MAIVHQCVQGSEEWLRLRMGRPTASSFDRIVTPAGKVSSAAQSYMCEILSELLLDRIVQGPNLAIMQRGHDLESHAVDYYEMVHDAKTEPIGFVTTDDGRYGASPDRRVVGTNGWLEVKCPAPVTHVGYMIANSVDKAYYPQLQGQLLVTGGEWVDIISYHPDMPMVLVRVERDEEFIEFLAKRLNAFCEDLEAKKQLLIERGYWQPKTEEKRDSTWFDVTAEDVDRMLATK